MRIIPIFVLVSIFVLASCSSVKQDQIITPSNTENSQQPNDELADEFQNITPPSKIPATPAWSGDGSSTFTSGLFNLKLTVPKNVLANEDRPVNDQGIFFTYDPDLEIDSEGKITYGTPYAYGKMEAISGKVIKDFLDTEESHQHEDFSIKELEIDEKIVTHVSFLTNCEGYEVIDNIYAVEHDGYLLEFTGHECYDMGDIVRTLEFLE